MNHEPIKTMRFLFLFCCFLFRGSPKAQTTRDLIPVDSGFYSSFDSTRIYYESRGKGKTVLLVHGFIANGSSWKRTALLKELVAGGFRVIVVDLRGNGRSDKPHEEKSYAADAEAKDLMGLMRYLKTGRYDAIGYSRGSIIVARLLVLDRQLDRAVLGGMGDGFTDPEWPRRKLFYEALSGQPVKELEGMVKYVKSQGLDTMILAWLQQYQPSTVPAELKKVRNRVLIISGDKDTLDGSVTRLAEMLPHAQLVLVPGEHNNTSQTKEFSDAVLSFLKKKRK
jgi:pimeloyl-ACP methyl ester carboxylesterase